MRSRERILTFSRAFQGSIPGTISGTLQGSIPGTFSRTFQGLIPIFVWVLINGTAPLTSTLMSIWRHARDSISQAFLLHFIILQAIKLEAGMAWERGYKIMECSRDRSRNLSLERSRECSRNQSLEHSRERSRNRPYCTRYIHVSMNQEWSNLILTGNSMIRHFKCSDTFYRIIFNFYMRLSQVLLVKQKISNWLQPLWVHVIVNRTHFWLSDDQT